MAEVGQKYYGKYRGTVVNNIDPLQIGRIQVQVPDVLGRSPARGPCRACRSRASRRASSWSRQIGAGVWVEFEHGDPDYPIWVGGFWGSAAEVPALALVPPAIPPGQNIVVQTTAQNTLVLSDSPPTPVSGGIVLKSTTGAMIVGERQRHLHPERQGRVDHADRPDGDGQHGRAGGDLGGRHARSIAPRRCDGAVRARRAGAADRPATLACW